MINYIRTQTGTLSIWIDGRSFSVDKSHTLYMAIAEILQLPSGEREKRKEELLELLQKEISLPGVELKDGVVYFRGSRLHNVIADRIMDMYIEGFDTSPMVKFLENLLENPNKTTVENLYTFLEHKNLPITDDGHFLAYKAVRQDLTDIHSGKFQYVVGQWAEMARVECDEDNSNECSRGLHVGTKGYVANFAGSNHRHFVTKVNPKDVVSVPTYDKTKLRASRILLMMEIDREDILDIPVYSSDGTPAKPLREFSDPFDGGEDFDEEDEEIYEDMWPEGVWAPEGPWELDSSESALPASGTGTASTSSMSRSQKREAVKARADELMAEHSRDSIVDLAFERSLLKSKRAGRALGKAACCALVAKDDLRNA